MTITEHGATINTVMRHVYPDTSSIRRENSRNILTLAYDVVSINMRKEMHTSCRQALLHKERPGDIYVITSE